MNDFWNARYADAIYAFGEEPNEFFKQELLKLQPGKLLLPAEGEGRNAVFAARMGWEVTAFDTSIEGKKKAEQLAKNFGVTINYEITDLENFTADSNSFDCVGFTFVHMPPEVRTRIHQKAISWLKPSSKIILQAFSKAQINETSGGPRDISRLFSEEELRADFSELSDIDIDLEEIILDEGKYHQGKAQVINLVGTK